MNQTIDISLPDYAEPLFQPYRYKVLYGGRGSAKSYSIARALLLMGVDRPLKILCARELQGSMADSVHSLLVGQMKELGLAGEYYVTQNSISGENGTEFLFRGVRHNVESIKSIPKVDILWLEEADAVSQASWDILVPTIRDEGSEIWVSYNPQNEDDPTHTKFVNTLYPPENSYIAKVNWRDNPWFPKPLLIEKDHLMRVNPSLAAHVWEGECRTNGDAQIFKDKWVVQDFEIPNRARGQGDFEGWDGPYFGADWGFANDPSTLYRMYIDVLNQTLYIRNEFYEVGVEIDDLPRKYDMIPQSRDRTIRADNARPETISYMCRQGFNVVGATKGKGSVEDGIEWLKSLNKIVIHPDCPNMAIEARKYSYKIDRLTGDITTDVLDAWNHGWDAVRYGLEPMISAGQLGILNVL